MLYIQKSQTNNLILNINNNSRNTFTSYDLVFTHAMSKEVKTYSINTSDPTVYFQNIRYCELLLDLTTDDLNYLGQYELKIYGQDGNELVYIGLVMLEGPQEGNPYTEYISPNEVDENYIYIQE